MGPNEALRAWRESAGLSLRAAASVFGIEDKTYIDFERGKTRPALPAVRAKMHKLCGIAPDAWGVFNPRNIAAAEKNHKMALLRRQVSQVRKDKRKSSRCACGKKVYNSSGSCAECLALEKTDAVEYVHPLRQQDRCDCVYYDRCLANAVGARFERNPDHVCKPGCKHLLVLNVYPEPVRTSPIADCGI